MQSSDRSRKSNHYSANNDINTSMLPLSNNGMQHETGSGNNYDSHLHSNSNVNIYTYICIYRYAYVYIYIYLYIYILMY
jgi:hypothetical protein